MAKGEHLALVMAIVAFTQGADMQANDRGPKALESTRAVQQKAKAEARLRLNAKKEWKDSSPVWVLMLSIKNPSQSPIFVQSTYPERDYTFEVRSENGDSIALSEEGKQLVTNTSVYKNVGIEIVPGDHFDELVNLSTLYDMPAPGNYFVTAKRRLKRKDGSEFEIASNTIKIVITT